MKKRRVSLVIILILIVSGTASCSREQASSGEVSRADDQSRLTAAALRAFFDHLAKTEFFFRVKKVLSGEYLVMDLPVYVP